MTAKTAAIRDIKAELKETSACFLFFHRELDPVMNDLVRDYTSVQASLNHKTQKP